jgi:hypothetical protein
MIFIDHHFRLYQTLKKYINYGKKKKSISKGMIDSTIQNMIFFR